MFFDSKVFGKEERISVYQGVWRGRMGGEAEEKRRRWKEKTAEIKRV